MKNHEKAGNDKNNEFFKGFNKRAVITRDVAVATDRSNLGDCHPVRVAMTTQLGERRSENLLIILSLMNYINEKQKNQSF